MHAVERELIKVTGYKAKRKFSDREDYLKSLLNDVMKLTDEDFDNLSDDAAEWANAAVDAHNSKHGTIPDFDEVKASEDDDSEPEADEADDETTGEEDESEADDDEAADPDDEEPADEDDAEGEDETSEDESEPEEAEDEDEPAPKPAKKKVVAKAKEKAPAKIPPKKVAAKKPAADPVDEDDDSDVVLDKWGCMVGSKNSQAVSMFEKGATTKEVKDTVGGTYYNLLKKMEANGHRLDKDGAIIKLTHKSALKETVKKKSK